MVAVRQYISLHIPITEDFTLLCIYRNAKFALQMFWFVWTYESTTNWTDDELLDFQLSVCWLPDQWTFLWVFPSNYWRGGEWQEATLCLPHRRLLGVPRSVVTNLRPRLFPGYSLAPLEVRLAPISSLSLCPFYSGYPQTRCSSNGAK